MAKIAVLSQLPLEDFIKHLELGGHSTIQTEDFLKLQKYEIFHFLFDCSLQKKPTANDFKILSFAVATKKQIAVSVRGPQIGFLFWPFLKAANMVTVEHKSHWLSLPAWVREKKVLEILTLPLSLPEEVDSAAVENFKPYYIESRIYDFLLVNQQTQKLISIPKTIPLAQQQLLVEHSSGYYKAGGRAGARPQLLSWDELINHLNRLYRSLSV